MREALAAQMDPALGLMLLLTGLVQPQQHQVQAGLLVEQAHLWQAGGVGQLPPVLVEAGQKEV
jgi:hypothetical protein